MLTRYSSDHLRFLYNRLKDKLWVKPLWMCICSILAVFIAKTADHVDIGLYILPISLKSIIALLEIMSSSMLVIATFSVGSMVSAYASASTSATPRSFSVVVSDDVSKNALSRFIGSFIFSIVALTAINNDFFDVTGLLVLFVLTCLVFALVILTFIRWVDRLARLGRIGNTVDRIEEVAMKSLLHLRNNPTRCGAPCVDTGQGEPVVATSVGYVQHLDLSRLQHWAEEHSSVVVLAVLPGAFVAPGTVLASVIHQKQQSDDFDYRAVLAIFQIGADRLFDDDPRFGLVVLSEIAGKALSPAVNDPGSAIKVIGSLVRLFVSWSEPVPEQDEHSSRYDRVQVPEITIDEMFDDAFTAIARDGAGCVEVANQLQKALSALSMVGDEGMKQAAKRHSELALKRCKLAMNLEEDWQQVEKSSLTQ
ncbi:DUF2254 domain-containing protein [Vibrio aphrogenes]|uniref:DUF2254 domain-containing protein n=1 Tax=Vibrio aphrogenes TaxID=1891186 RepID=UPI000B35F9B0|nr:DUF2254 domain-containing protein [Vibrio aphrogenes]